MNIEYIKEQLNNFSFAQMVSNSATGKTSASASMGVYICLVSMICFVIGCMEFHYSGKSDILIYSSANIGVGSGMLMYNKSQVKHNNKTSSTEITIAKDGSSDELKIEKTN